MRFLQVAVIAGIISLGATASGASETVGFTYDAKGRLVKVVRSGSVNAGITTDIVHDKANNRVRLKVSGAAR